MKKYLALALLALFSQSAQGDVICLKNSQKYSVSASRKVTVKAPQLLTTSAATCPSGYTQLTQFVKEETVKTSFTGVWNLSGGPSESYTATTISFPEALSSAPTQTIFVESGTTNTTCTGTVESPTAPAGVLCVYEAVAINLDSPVSSRYFMYRGIDNNSGASKFGGAMYGYQDNPANNFYAWGTWAVTKP